MKFNKIIKLILVFVFIAIITCIIALSPEMKIIPGSGEIMRTTTADLSTLFASFLLAFEVLAVLLTAAMVGAIVIAKKDKKIDLKGGDAQ